MKTIGRYRIKGLLGKGGMGRVFKAELPVVDKMVALKHFNPHEHMLDLLGREHAAALFHTEARILANIHHPHVAALLDFDYDAAGRPFFVMEYLCMNLGALIGETYATGKKTRRLPPERAAKYMDQTLDGLGRLHHAGIIHRDIKPYNILLTDDDRVKIIDLGLSRLRGEVRALPETFKVGTPFYAPPEQEAHPDRADERADLFSAGVLLWRMLTGELPPEFGPPQPPSRLNPLLGTIWDETLFTGIARDAGNRFQSCDAMRQAVAAAFENWRETLEQACRYAPPEAAAKSAAGGRPLRKTPAKVSPARAQSIFGLDEWFRPKEGLSGRYADRGGHTVADTRHGLLWQTGGSPYPLDWQAAGRLVRQLNQEGFEGLANWRLPTVDELLTLVRPKTVLGDFCPPSVFNTRQNRLWSCDKKSFTAAWYVDTDLGFAGSQDMSCRFYVRAVADA